MSTNRSPYRSYSTAWVLQEAFRADLVVEGRLLIELKSTEQHAPVHAKQVITYLRLMNLPLGLLMDFGAPTFNRAVGD
jgi:GxxExxY protein